MFSDFRDPMIIFCDSRDPNRVPKNALKTLILQYSQVPKKTTLFLTNARYLMGVL